MHGLAMHRLPPLVQVIVFKFPLENVKHVNGECGDGAMHFSSMEFPWQGFTMASMGCVCVHISTYVDR